MRNPNLAGEPARTLCVFCTEGASGDTGHPGVAQQVHAIPGSDRSYVRLTCEFCGAQWVRHRVRAHEIEWLRIVD